MEWRNNVVQTDLDDSVTSWLVSDWFIVDGKWRHLAKRYMDGMVTFYCDGKLVKTITEAEANERS